MTDTATTSVAVQLLESSPPPPNHPANPTSSDHQCGLCGWRPACLQRAANIRAFLAAVCFISCLQAAFSGYTASQVTTLEKRFAVGSSVIGIVNSFFEVGYIISVVFVSYVGGRGHVPALISLGLFVMAAGAFLWCIPHFVFSYDGVRASANVLNPLCLNSNNIQSSPDQSFKCGNDQPWGYGFLFILFLAQLLIGSGSSPVLTLAPPFIDDHVPASKAPPMIAAQHAAAAMGPVFGFGLGAVMLQYPAELFTTHLLEPDDPNWIGAWWVGFVFLGVLVLIGALILLSFPRQLRGVQKQPTTWRSVRTSLAPVQENGTVLTGFEPDRSSVAQLDRNTAITYPNSPSEPPTPEDADISNSYRSATLFAADRGSPWSRTCLQSCSRSRGSPYTCAPHLRCRLFDSSSYKLSNFFDSVSSLIRNRVYLVVSLCICSEMFMIIGFASFLPKYLEMEYQISKLSASIIAGGLVVPAGAVGIIVGGIILNRFRFHRRGAIRFVLVVNVIILGCIGSFFFLGCNNPPIAGLTVEYQSDGVIQTNPGNSQNPAPVTEISTFPNFPWPTAFTPAQLSVTCNAHCSCDPNLWSPVCHVSSGMSFVSPCFAGCSNGSVPSISTKTSALGASSWNKDEVHTYTHCNCVPASSVPTTINTTTIATTTQSGLCPLNCGRMGYFLFVLTLCLFLTGVIQNPLVMVTMRSVDHHERAFALGLQFVIIRVFANLPSPMVFGRVIDGACLLWRLECGRRGDCSFVDVHSLNLYLTGLGIIIKGTGFIFYFLLLHFLRSAASSQVSAQFNFPTGPLRKSLPAASLSSSVAVNKNDPPPPPSSL